MIQYSTAVGEKYTWFPLDNYGSIKGEEIKEGTSHKR